MHNLFCLFHRHIRRIENSNWETSFEKIVMDVQSFMKTYHGAELKICWPLKITVQQRSRYFGHSTMQGDKAHKEIKLQPCCLAEVRSCWPHRRSYIVILQFYHRTARAKKFVTSKFITTETIRFRVEPTKLGKAQY